MTRAKGSESKLVATNAKKRIAAILTHLLRKALKVEKCCHGLAEEQNEFRHFTEHIPCDWNGRVEVIKCTIILQPEIVWL